MPIREEHIPKDFVVKINAIYKRIKISDIFYFKSDGKYILLAIESREFAIKLRLKNLKEILPLNFVQCHASFVVNLDKISSIVTNPSKIILSNNVEMPLSRTYKNELFSRFVVC